MNGREKRRAKVRAAQLARDQSQKATNTSPTSPLAHNHAQQSPPPGTPPQLPTATGDDRDEGSKPTEGLDRTHAVDQVPPLAPQLSAGTVVHPPQRRDDLFSIQLVDPLFAVAIHIGLVEGLMRTEWFLQARVLTAQEWRELWTFVAAMLNVLLSWLGYHQSIERRPIRGTMRFLIDLVLIILYSALLVQFRRLQVVTVLFAVIFLLYVIWDIFKVREYPPRKFPQFYPSSGEGVNGTYGRELVSVVWFLAFTVLAAVSFQTWASDSVVIVLLLVSCFGYRLTKNRRVSELLGIAAQGNTGK